MSKTDIIVSNEDDTFLNMMQEILEDEGYTVHVAKQSHDAFEDIKDYQPRLVILEMTLNDPERGWMVLNKMRLWPQTVVTPIIIASASTQLIRDNEAHLRSKGCDILMKPFTLDELLAFVHKALD